MTTTPREATVLPGLRIVPFEVAHYLEATAVLYARWPRSAMAQPETVAHFYALGGPAFTVLTADDTVAAVAGIVNLWEGLGNAWIVISDEVRHPESARGFHYLVGRMLRRLQDRFQWRCVLAHVMTDQWRDNCWTAALGFEPLGDIRHYGPGGEMFTLWARYPGDPASAERARAAFRRLRATRPG
jgi:hypothetical protein